mgnify:CR=1 FL=1
MDSERDGRSRIEFRDAPMEGDLFNTLVLLAEILEEKDLGITFNRSANQLIASNVRNIEPKIAFDTTDEGEEVLTRLMNTPEYRTIKLVSTYHDAPETLPELLECHWDENTQGRVYVTFLERKATGFELDAKTATQSETRALARKEAIGLTTLAAFYRRALENKRPIGAQDAKALLLDLVDRKLPKTTQPQ